MFGQDDSWAKNDINHRLDKIEKKIDKLASKLNGEKEKLPAPPHLRFPPNYPYHFMSNDDLTKLVLRTISPYGMGNEKAAVPFSEQPPLIETDSSGRTFLKASNGLSCYIEF